MCQNVFFSTFQDTDHLQIHNDRVMVTPSVDWTLAKKKERKIKDIASPPRYNPSLLDKAPAFSLVSKVMVMSRVATSSFKIMHGSVAD